MLQGLILFLMIEDLIAFFINLLIFHDLDS